jgi:hypothetical protein
MVMFQRTVLGAAIATLACGFSLTAASSAQAATLRLADLEGADAEGVFAALVPRSPGIYGLEARGGRPGNRDWEIGVGIWTSVLNPSVTPGIRNFTEANFDWAASDDLFDFEMSWMDDLVTVTIGDQTVEYAADWQIGNTIKISAVGDALFNLIQLDGIDFSQTVAGTPDSGLLESIYLTGDTVLDGWSLSGTIDLANGGGSRNEVLITMGNFEPDASVPEPTTVLGLVILGGFGAGSLLKQRSSCR